MLTVPWFGRRQSLLRFSDSGNKEKAHILKNVVGAG